MTDEGGVLGNLPNSRPGRRSAKRDRPAKTADKAAMRAEAAGKPAAEASGKPAAEASGKPAADPKTSRAKRTSAKPGRAAAGAASPRGRTTAVKGGDSGDGVRVRHDIGAQRGHGSASSSGDPLSAAVRTAAGLAIGGVKVGGAVTKELLRRLPRP